MGKRIEKAKDKVAAQDEESENLSGCVFERCSSNSMIFPYASMTDHNITI